MSFAEAVEKDNIISCQRDYSKSVSIRHQHPEKDRLLTPAPRTYWEENGYVIIPNAVPQENLDAVIDALWEFLKVNRSDPETWDQAPANQAEIGEATV